jgi:hypothetical protein
MKIQTCGKCQFYVETDQDCKSGECHRFPPARYGNPANGEYLYPAVLDDIDWCGEFSPVYNERELPPPTLNMGTQLL